MNWLIQLFEKAIIRRVAYFIAPFLLGWISQAWWIQDALHSWGVHPDNIDEFKGELVLGLTGLFIGVNEFIAWYRKQKHISVKDDFACLVVALKESGKLDEALNVASKDLNVAAQAILDDVAKRKAKEQALAIARGGALSILLFSFTLSCSAFGQSLPQPNVSIQTNSIVEFVKFMPKWNNIEGVKDFFNACGTNLVFNGVYSISTKGGVSSGGMAVVTSLMDLNYQLEPDLLWSLHFGPAFIMGDDKNGIFSAIEGAMFTDALGNLMEVGRRQNPFFKVFPSQIDKLYLFIGAGISTSASVGAGSGPIVSMGAGYRF